MGVQGVGLRFPAEAKNFLKSSFLKYSGPVEMYRRFGRICSHLFSISLYCPDWVWESLSVGLKRPEREANHNLYSA